MKISMFITGGLEISIFSLSINYFPYHSNGKNKIPQLYLIGSLKKLICQESFGFMFTGQVETVIDMLVVRRVGFEDARKKIGYVFVCLLFFCLVPTYIF